MTELSPSGFYQLGLRQAAQMPLVLLIEDDYVTAVEPDEFHFVRYLLHESLDNVGDPQTIGRLVTAIEEALELKPRSTGLSTVRHKATPRERRFELADRIEETAEVLRLLR